MVERIQVEIEDGVADIRMLRADKLNALDDAMFEALIDTAEQIDANQSVRCVVLSGEGRAFCAGLDMGNFGKMAEGSAKRDSLSKRTHGIANRPQQAVWAWRNLRVPTIVSVHGVALGGGFQVMLGGDIRIAHPETKLSILEVKWGLVPDMGATAIMRQLAREDIVRELTYTGRMFSGVEAQAYGFVTHVSETPLEDALKLAGEISRRSPDAVQAAKMMFTSLPDKSDAEALLSESVAQDKLIGRPNQIEVVIAGLQKRDAVFNG